MFGLGLLVCTPWHKKIIFAIIVTSQRGVNINQGSSELCGMF